MRNGFEDRSLKIKYHSSHLLPLSIIPYLNIVLSLISIPVAHSENSNVKKNLLTVDITTYLGDNQTFLENDQISFLVSVDKEAYIVLVYQDSEQNIRKIYPSGEALSSNRLQAGMFHEMPPKSDQTVLLISPPYGEDTIWAFATEQPLPLWDENKNQGGINYDDVTELRYAINKYCAYRKILCSVASLKIKVEPRRGYSGYNVNY